MVGFNVTGLMGQVWHGEGRRKLQSQRHYYECIRCLFKVYLQLSDSREGKQAARPLLLTAGSFPVRRTDDQGDFLGAFLVRRLRVK